VEPGGIEISKFPRHISINLPPVLPPKSPTVEFVWQLLN
jgi:hypothetical protein